MGTTPGHGGLAMQSKPTTSVLGLVLSPPRGLLNLLLCFPLHHRSPLWCSHLRSEAEHTPSLLRLPCTRSFICMMKMVIFPAGHRKSRQNKMVDREEPLSHQAGNKVAKPETTVDSGLPIPQLGLPLCSPWRSGLGGAP